jgi:hypothetical protein
VYLGVGAGAAWVGSKALPIDGRLLEAPAAVPLLVVSGLGLGLLRAKNWFAVVPGIAADASACAGASAIQDHLFSAGRLHLDTLGARLTVGSLAASVLVTVLGIVVAAVAGHRHPREDSSTGPAKTTPPTGT